MRNPRLTFAVASMLYLPYPDGVWTGVVAMYSIIHLNPAERVQAFAEFARTLRPGGLLLVSFHVDGPGFKPGDVNRLRAFLGHYVEMDGYFLDPSVVTTDLVANGFRVQARLDREPIADIEFPSRRCYILARRTVPSPHGPRA
jgi:SAM-dependent methyltransferase